jgi:hypothetical protein
MIRCVRIWTGEDQNSHFEEGWIELEPGAHGDLLSGNLATAHASFQETRSGGTLAWHTAPVRQLVITLSGTLDFQTRGGQHFMLKPGDILLAEDTAGGGIPGSWSPISHGGASMSCWTTTCPCRSSRPNRPSGEIA